MIIAAGFGPPQLVHSASQHARTAPAGTGCGGSRWCAPQGGGAVYVDDGATATFTDTAFTSNTAVTDAPHAVSAHAHRRAGARTPLVSTRRKTLLTIHHRVPLTWCTSPLALRAHARRITMAGNDSEVASLF